MLNDEPDFEKFAEFTRGLVQAKAQLEFVKVNLEVYQAELCRQKPRDATVKLIGVDEQSKRELDKLRWDVSNAQLKVDEIEAELKILNFQRDMAKTRFFNGKA